MRISHAAKRVFQAFLDAPDECTYGFELARAANLASGTIYPILRRLESEGIVESWWGAAETARVGTPRRRYYRLTGKGRRIARTETAREADGLRQLMPGWQR